jgi:hypothetical protein
MKDARESYFVVGFPRVLFSLFLPLFCAGNMLIVHHARSDVAGAIIEHGSKAVIDRCQVTS